jgi:hypothetical protein
MRLQDFPFTAGLRVTCEKDAVGYRFRAGGASLESGQPMHYLHIHEPGCPNQPVTFEAGDAFEREIACFVDCVRTGNPPADARLAVRTALPGR